MTFHMTGIETKKKINKSFYSFMKSVKVYKPE